MSHFSCIGLGGETSEPFEAIMEQLLGSAAEEISGHGKVRHARWSDESGASMVFHLDGDDLVCATPFFAAPGGATRWRARTAAPSDDGECVHCGGADCNLLDESGEMVTRSTVQWLYFAPYRDWLGVARSFELEIAAFAHAAGFYDDAAAFDAGQASWWGDAKNANGDPLRFAEKAFLPEGMFAADGASLGDRATVMLTGTVESASPLRNQLTGNSFWQVRIDTLPGAVDVVLDPADVDGEPARGKLAMVRAWLVGRPVEPPPSPAERSWLRRIFKK